MTCACGHDADEHQFRTGRCEGKCFDPEYGQFNCLCPYVTEEKL